MPKCRIMTDTLKTFREATGMDDAVLVLVVPQDKLPALFSGGEGRPSDVELDLTVAQYRERYEPDLSESRIAEMCAAGVFPDSVAPDGDTIPGAYKTRSNHWRITKAGIQARQKRDREEGLKRRQEEAVRKAEQSEGIEETAAVPPFPQASQEPKRKKKAPAAAPARRAGEELWRDVIQQRPKK